MGTTFLASTLHDPENRLNELAINYGPIIKQMFKTSHVIVTPLTNPKIIKTLKNLEFETSMGYKNTFDTYKKALKSALNSNQELIFYCDFDRILHWAKTHPNELKNILNSYLDYDFLLLARTSRAFNTHPKTQIKTEEIINQIASKASGFTITKDIISACWRFTPRLVEKLLQLQIENTNGFYCEWPIVAWRQAQNPKYLEVEGLEWETPDRYPKEIKDKGYKRWLQEFQTPQEWEKRIKILKDAIQSISTYLKKEDN